MSSQQSCVFFVLFSIFSWSQNFEKTDAMFDEAEVAVSNNNFELAAQLYQEAALNEMQIDGFRLEFAIDLLENASWFFFKTNQLDNAIDNKSASLLLEEKYYGEDRSKYALGLAWLMHFYFTAKNYEEVVKQHQKAITLANQHLENHPEEHLMLLNNCARSLQIMGQKQQALTVFLDLIAKAEKKIGKQAMMYGLYLNNLAQLYWEMLQYNQALPLFLEAVNIALINPDENKDYMKLFLNNLNKFYSVSEQFQAGLNYNQNLSKQLPINVLDLIEAEVYNGFAMMYIGLEDFNQAENYYLKALKAYEAQNESQTDDYAILLCNLSETYRQKGHFQTALTYGNKGVNLLKELIGNKALEYGIRLNNLALIYQNTGDFEQAVLMINEVLPIAEAYYGLEHPEYNTILGALGQLYQAMGQLDKAEILMLEIVQQIQKSSGKNNTYYLIALNNLANLYMTMRYLTDAEKYFIESLAITERINGKQHSAYARQLSNLSIVYQQLGKIQEAINLQQEAVEISKKVLGEDHIDYAKYINNLAVSYLSLKELTKAIPLQKKAIEIVVKNTNPFNPELVNYWKNLAQSFQIINDFDNGFMAVENYLSILKNQIQVGFNLLSENEKIKFIEQLNISFYFAHSFLTDYQKKTGKATGIGYDIELITKSLILNASADVRQRILESNNPKIKQLYQDWLQNQNFLAKQYALPAKQQVADIYYYEIQSERLEKQLIQFVKNNYAIQPIGQTTWKEVQNQLKDNEIAIEFSSFPFWKQTAWDDDLRYQAIILQKNQNLPITIPLFTQKELDDILSQSGNDKQVINQLYRGAIGKSTKQDLAKLYQLIWQPLEPYLKAGQTIYYAPSGTLNQMAFAAIQNQNKQFLSDIYKLHQVTSTANILDLTDRITVNQVHLFGGIQYNLERKQGPTDAWDYLIGTLEEVNNIATIAKKSNLTVNLYNDKQATETIIKTFDFNQQPHILHLATHGYFYPNPTQSTNSIADNAFVSSSNSLTRSGLLMAGANDFWGTSNTSKDTEDGILTAFEVANLNLSNTQLVVLSACETGLGDINGNEGVFGLQRAFKMAGVNYILMSLWKVPDLETKEFMTEFYNQYFSTKNIEASYYNTQNYMKTKYPNNLYSWAAFVLVR